MPGGKSPVDRGGSRLTPVTRDVLVPAENSVDSERETLLITDDEPAIRKLLHLKLSGEGYRCEEAGGAEQALNTLDISPIALVVLDVKMPGKSGIELLPEIKRGYPDTAVIMATAVNDIGVAIECLKQGADDYICKPFNLEEVSLSVQRALEKRNLKLEIRDYQQYLEEKIEEQTGQIRKIFLGAIEALVSALEAKDRYTGGHSRRVAEVALALGNELGLSANDMEDLRWGSLLHDIGKIAVDPAIQNKPDKLTPDEYESIMIHARVGAEIVRPVVNKRISEMIEHHHDRYDGGGLHQVTSGDEVPLGARILAVADSFDAMVCDRPYRLALPMTEIVDEIRRCSGTQFDPAVVAAFLNTVGMTANMDKKVL
jgi:putative two-component system response regulator